MLSLEEPSVQMSDESGQSDSIERQNRPLFDQDEFKTIEKDPRLSLQLLANCVYITTCTVLHERQLLPAKSFTDFNVYGNTKGYFMNEKDRHGSVVAKKFASASETIANRTLNKFALIIEMDENTTPIEAFVWSFKYDTPGEAAARLGFKGKSQIFTVKYTDMHETSRQFCKLFSSLREVLKDLEPLPDDAMPSFRLALRDEPVDLDGYFSVEEFVNMKQLELGKVRYPREEAVLTYASNYKASENASTMAMSNASHTELRNLQTVTSFDEPSPIFETTRQEEPNSAQNETLRFNKDDDDDSFMDIDVPAAENVSQHSVEEKSLQSDAALDDSGLSLQCEPNVVSQQEYRPESAETLAIGTENIYSSLKSSPPARERRESAESAETMVLSAENIYSNLQASPPAQEQEQKEPPKKVEKKKPKRASRKLADMVFSSDEAAEAVSQKPTRRSARHRVSFKAMVDEVSHEEPAPEAMEVIETAEIVEKVPRYGRVSSILSLAAEKSQTSKKYGRVPSVRDLKLSPAKKISVEVAERRYAKSRNLIVRLI